MYFNFKNKLKKNYLLSFELILFTILFIIVFILIYLEINLIFY